VWVADSNGCAGISDVVKIVVKENNNLNIHVLGSPVFCRGDSVVIEADSGYVTYAWSNGATSRRIVVRSSVPFQ